MTERQPICDEIAAAAAGLMAMPANAPERKRAEEHARSCDRCPRALDEGRQLLAVIQGEPMPVPSPSVLERAAAPIARELQGAPRFAAIVGAAVLAAWALPLAMMRAPVTPTPDLWVSIALAVGAAVMTAGVTMGAGRKGAPFVFLSALTLIVPGSPREGLEPLLGLHCALTEALTAAGATVAAFLAARALGRYVLDRRVLAAALGGGALAGHAALQLGCRAAHEWQHVIVFHTGPVLLAVVLALVVATAAARRAATT